MIDRESILPLALGFVIAVVLHVVLAPQAAEFMLRGDVMATIGFRPDSSQASLPPPPAAPDAPKPAAAPGLPPPPDRLNQPDDDPAPPDQPKPNPPQPEKDNVKLGRDNGPDVVTVAWIPYDEYQKLIARHSLTEQPALQRDVDPVPNAPLPLEPTPPSPPKPSPAVALAQATSPETPSLLPVPSRQAEAESPIKAPAVPRSQDQAKAPVTNDAEPTRQTAADTPTPDPKGKPLEQPDAQSERSLPGVPTNQPKSRPPRLINTDPAQEGPTPTPDPTPAATALKDPAKSSVSIDGPPTTQPEATAVKPEPQDPRDAAKPIRQVEAEAPKTTDGKPTTQPEAKTPKPDPDGELATAKPSPGEDDPLRKTERDRTTDAPAAAAGDARTPRQPSDAARPSRPTAAPRDDRESPPTIRDGDALEVNPGSVITGRGIEIKTVRPRFSIVSLLSAAPRSPKVKVTFSKEGAVTEAVIVKSSGYADIDGSILASLYKWRAAGEELEKRGKPFTIELKILMGQ
jgi:hypothetical protein